MNCLITTHWPSPEGMEVARNVYFNARRKSLPAIGDIVLIYEAETATVNGKRVTRAEMRYRGRREWVELPRGRGRIVGAVTVVGEPRGITDENRVYDYGNLDEWSLVPCGAMREVREVSRGEVIEVLGKSGSNVRYWGLWKVPDEFVGELREKLGV